MTHLKRVRACLICGLILHNLLVMGQSKFAISGIVKDPSGRAIAGATVALSDSSNTNTVFCMSGSDGHFMITILQVLAPPLTLKVSHIGYATSDLILHQALWAADSLITVVLRPTSTTHPEVVIRASLKPNKDQTDTIEFDAKVITGPQILKVEDLLRNIKGFVVDARGQISFDGYPIDKILIDGQDLAGSSYHLISKYLGANAIDKVQVINNYAENRLIKRLEHSEKTAINLRIKKAFLNKVSGSLEPGASLSDKKTFNANTFLLKSKAKLMILSNYNNIGDAADNNVDYYFGRDGSNSNLPADEPPIRAIVSSTAITVPLLSDRYANKNNDRNCSFINTWTVNNKISIRSLTTIGNENKISIDSVSNTTYAPDIYQWSNKSNERSMVGHAYLTQNIVMNHDNLKNRTGLIFVSYTNHGDSGKYSNYFFGNTADTLTERLRSKLTDLKFRAQETFKVKHSALTVAIGITGNYQHQTLFENTKRLGGYFKIDSSLDNIFQSSGQTANQGFLSVKWIGKSRRMSYNYGAEVQFARFQSRKTVFLGSDHYIVNATVRSTDTSVYVTNQQKLFSRFKYVAGKQIIEFDLAVGYGKQNSPGEVSVQAVRSILGNAAFTLTKHLTPLKHLTFAANFSTSLPDANLFHNAGFLSGNATIENGAQMISPVRMANASVSYTSNNLLNNVKFSATCSYNISLKDYVPNYTLATSYTAMGWIPSKNKHHSTLMFSVEKYLAGLKCKTIISSEATISKMSYIANDHISQNNTELVRSQFQYISTFKSIVNLEFSFTALYSKMNISANAIVFKHEIFQYEGYGKMKLRWSEKMYSNILYGLYFYNRTNIFQTSDAYLVYRVNTRWTLSTTIHNLFNEKHFVSRSQSSNVETYSSFAIVNRYMLWKIQFDF